MGVLQEKQDQFIKALNEALPIGVHCQAVLSQHMPNVVNILIGYKGMVVQAFGLIEDAGVVHWFENTIGRLY